MTNFNESTNETLITVSLPEKLYASAVALKRRDGYPSLSAVIRTALLQYDIQRPVFETSKSLQVSFRASSELRQRINRQARAGRVSVGRIVRVALQALSSNPTTTPQNNTTMAKKKVAAPKAAAKATKKPAKKK